MNMTSRYRARDSGVAAVDGFTSPPGIDRASKRRRDVVRALVAAFSVCRYNPETLIDRTPGIFTL
jgi:hypothetical protein